jgi:tRNA1(Val) A37 N6-methylase TrmN6
LIISNPPWEDQHPQSIDEYALYDHGFELLDSLLSQLGERLNPGGKALLAYGNVTAIRKAIELGGKYDLNVEVLDERAIDELPENFLPGMLLEFSCPAPSPS